VYTDLCKQEAYLLRLFSAEKPDSQPIQNQSSRRGGEKKETKQQEKDKTELKLTSHGGFLVDGT